MPQVSISTIELPGDLPGAYGPSGDRRLTGKDVENRPVACGSRVFQTRVRVDGYQRAEIGQWLSAGP